MEKKITVQKLNKQLSTDIQVAEAYYNVLSALNNLGLTHREIQLVAFAAVRGNISYANIRKEFCELYSSSSASINNIISRLKKIGVFVKDGTKVKVNPQITLNFENNIVLQIALKHG